MNAPNGPMFRLVITNYQKLLNNITCSHYYNELGFSLVVLDEGHMIKNRYDNSP